jgi:hypothetical protein
MQPFLVVKEEGKQVFQALCGELKSPSGMIDGWLRLVTHGERILRKGESTVRSQFVQATQACLHAMVIIDDDHERILFLTI